MNFSKTQTPIKQGSRDSSVSCKEASHLCRDPIQDPCRLADSRQVLESPERTQVHLPIRISFENLHVG